MKKKLISVCLLLIMMSAYINAKELVPIDKVEFVTAKKNVAKELLTTPDIFLKSLSFFDRSARLHTSREIGDEEFTDYIAAQAANWSFAEKKKIKKVILKAVTAINVYSVGFPETIYFIKTTGKEEGMAAYCRGDNIIVIPDHIINYSYSELTELVVHELFHILTRNNQELKDELYAILSFKKTANLQLPEELADLKITNPDAALNDYFFVSPQYDPEVMIMPLLLAGSQYDDLLGGEFFDYLGFYLLPVKEEGDKTVPLTEDGEYVLLSPHDVPEYFDFIGQNTDYIIHPEEVLADNFVLLVIDEREVPSEWILTRMDEILRAN